MGHTTRALIAGVVLMGLVVPASAGSVIAGKKLEVEVEQAKIDAEKAALWDRFGGFCAIADWHPGIKSCVETSDGGKTFRTLTLNDGGVVEEELVDAGRFAYKYKILNSPLPVKNYIAQFSIVPDDDDLDEVNFSWSATFDADKGKSPKEARKIIDDIFQAGLDAIGDKINDAKKS